MRDVASGHAILASCKKYKRGGHGYWLARTDSGRPPDLFDPYYPEQAPPLLLRELDRLDDTGSVVCITAFNNFRSDTADPAAAIERVAAKNFLAAIWSEKMTVTIRNEDDPETVVNRETLGEILQRDRARKLGEQKGGWLPGAQAYQAWEALEQGERFTLGAGADAYVLPLDQHEARSSSRVQVFRNGMWITNNADELEPRRFRGNKPFAAVIMVESGKLARLVRGAEGPEHRGLHRRRLELTDSKELLLLLRKIADELRLKAGEEEESKEFTPDDFAMWTAGAQRQAERVGKYRPRRSTGQDKGTALEKANEGRSIDPRKRKGKKRKKPAGAAPKPGRGVSARSSWVAVPGDEGRIHEVRVAWQLRDDGLHAKDVLGVRVRVPSGSDETCEVPLAPRWLPIKSVRFSGHVVRPSDDGYEAQLPNDCRNFTVVLAEPATDPNAIEIDLVRRRPPTEAAND